MTYHATGRNGTLVVEEPITLPEGSRVEVEVRPATQAQPPIPSLYERLKPIIGSAKGLPSDMAENHDHYRHGLPKGIDSE